MACLPTYKDKRYDNIDELLKVIKAEMPDTFDTSLKVFLTPRQTPKPSIIDFPIIETDDIINFEGKKGAAQYDRDNKVIKVNRGLLQEKFKEKAWTKPRELMETLNGEQVKSFAQALPSDQFKTYDEWEQFVINHEYEHSLYSREDFDREFPNKTKGDYESEINRRALSNPRTFGITEAAQSTQPTQKPQIDIELLKEEDKNKPFRKSVEYKLQNRIAGIENPEKGNEVFNLATALKIAGSKLKTPLKFKDAEIPNIYFDKEESGFRFNYKNNEFAAFYLKSTRGIVRWNITKLDKNSNTFKSISNEELENINEKYGSQKGLLETLGFSDVVKDIEYFENLEYSKEDYDSAKGTIIPLINSVSLEQIRLSKKYGVTYTLEDFIKEYEEELIKAQPTQKTVERVASNFSGFQGYKGGFEQKGKGTPEGDGKDKAMRIIANSFIGEEDGAKSQSSTRTSAETINELESNNNNIENVASLKQYKVQGYTNTLIVDNYTNTINSVVMLARNGSLKNIPLRKPTKEAILNANNNGAEFIVGDMPGVDSQFIEYLQEIGAKFTVYHTGSTPRIKISESSTQVPAKSGVEVVKKLRGSQLEETLFASSFAKDRQKEIVSNFALKHKMSEEQAIEYINQAVAQKGQQAIDKLKECY